jgi:hypothetical protein
MPRPPLLVDRGHLLHIYGLHHFLLGSMILDRCAKCRRLVAGICLCAFLSGAGEALLAGAELPLYPADQAKAWVAGGATGTATATGRSLLVDDQITGNTYSAAWPDLQQRAALYNPMGPNGAASGGDSATATASAGLKGPTGPRGVG